MYLDIYEEFKEKALELARDESKYTDEDLKDKFKDIFTRSLYDNYYHYYSAEDIECNNDFYSHRECLNIASYFTNYEYIDYTVVNDLVEECEYPDAEILLIQKILCVELNTYFTGNEIEAVLDNSDGTSPCGIRCNLYDYLIAYRDDDLEDESFGRLINMLCNEFKLSPLKIVKNSTK